MKKILILNGPNLNMLGKREPGHYGTATLAEIEKMVRGRAKEIGCECEFFQSNAEGALIDRIHAAMGKVDAILFNGGFFIPEVCRQRVAEVVERWYGKRPEILEKERAIVTAGTSDAITAPRSKLRRR